MPRKLIYPEKEAYIYSDDPDTNFGSSSTIDHLRFGTGSGSKKTRAIIQFPTADFPADSSKLYFARLKLFFGDYDLDTVPTKQYLNIRYLTNEWVEDEVTWNDRVTGTAWTSSGGDYSDPGAYDHIQFIFGRYYRYVVQITITDIVKDWIDGTYDNNGIIIFFTVEGVQNTIARLKTRYADAPTLLEINYQDANTAVERHFRPPWISANKWQMVTGQLSNTITMPRNPEDVRVIPPVDIGIQQTIGRREKRVSKWVSTYKRRLTRRTFILSFPPEGRSLIKEFSRMQSMGRVIVVYPTGFYDVREEADRQRCWRDEDFGS